MTVAPSQTPASPTPTPSSASTTTAHAVTTSAVTNPPSVTSVVKASDTNLVQVPADATCVEFLHLMKAFSESAVNVTEMAQRVDSLVHQDEQLLRLLPLTTKTSTGSSEDPRGSLSGDSTDDESSSSGRVDLDAIALGLPTEEEMNKWKEENESMEEDEEDDGSFVSDEMDIDFNLDEDEEDEDDMDDGSSTDAETHRSSQPRIGSIGTEEDDESVEEDERRSLTNVDVLDERDQERRAQEDLQRWMELELDLDSTVDPYDASLHLPGVETTLQTTSNATASGTTTGGSALEIHTSLAPVAGSHANSSSVLTATTGATPASKDRLRALGISSVFDKKSVTAALFDDEDEDDEDDDDLVLLNSLMRKKNAAMQANKPALTGSKRSLDDESKSEEDVSGGVIWGMEVDTYEQDLLSSIDHAVLCDRENRFLQWDLEIEAATAAAAVAAATQKTELRTPTSTLSSVSNSFSSSFMDNSRQKLMTTSSPRDQKVTQVLRSPSNVDTNLITEDWSSLDFGTFQNRTVSHILSSCLHKRKLHHPYKDRVTLVNFNVPGGEPIGPPPSQTSGLVPGSVLFGAGLETDLLLKSNDHSGVLSILSSTSGGISKDGKTGKNGEKKAKKPRTDGERKKSSQKLDGMSEFDTDPMTKLENMPLPDLTNLPQDLKELKRKIEATEHKVEGTKHRHRKGGPCPRCQVQNQLRAAKRAYHKRAVAHKKLPQLGTVSPALTATAVTSPTASPSVDTTPIVVSTPGPTLQAPPVTVVPEASVTDVVKKVVESPSAVSLLSSATIAASASAVRPATLPTTKDTTVSTLVSVARATMAPVSSTMASNSTAASVIAASAAFPRRPCGENALTSSFSSPASVPSSASAPSSPENSSASSSPQVHHVTVTSA